MSQASPKNPNERVAGREVRGIVLAAGLGACLAEAGVAKLAVLADHGSLLEAALAGVVTLGLLLAPALPVALGVGLLLGSSRVRALGRALMAAFGAGPEGSRLAALGALLGVLAGAVALGAVVGRSFVLAMTPPFAAAATAGATVLAVVGLGVLAAGSAGAAARSVIRVTRHAPWLEAPAVPAFLLLVVWVVGGGRLLPRPYVAAPAGSLLALGVASLAPVRARLGRALGGRTGWVVLAIGWLLALLSPLLLSRSPAVVQGALLYRAPYASLGIGLAQRAIDRDHDGYSPVLLGGDCDDGDKKVHAGARDKPGNRVDENCFAGDARPFTTPISPPEPEVPAGARPNLVVIVLDALRPDHLGFGGYARPTSPALDAFRENATWFPNAFSPAPTTRFAVASLLTGTYPLRLPYKPGQVNDFLLEERATTLAESLARKGYTTAAFTISYVVQHNRGTGQGFATWKTPWPVDKWQENYPSNDRQTTEAAIGWLNAHPPKDDAPFLLLAHYRCGHDPNLKSAAHDFGGAPVDLYDSAVANCDAEVGRLLAALDARGDREGTTIVIVSDHGELFGEHGLTNHGNSLYETDVRVLMLARVPGRTPSVVDAPVTLPDVTATLYALAGVARPASVDGWSLLPLLSAGADVAAWRARPLFLYADVKRGSTHYQSVGVLEWPRKLVRDLRTGRNAVYDVVADPLELHDLSSTLGADRARLEALVDSYLSAGAR